MTKAELDRISFLPDHLIDRILSDLPTMEVVRTSILSSKWKNKWTAQPNLVFDKQCVSAAASQDSKLLRIIDHVLLVHDGSINKFEISSSINDLNSVTSVDIDRWILHLIKKSIKVLVLDVWIGEYYKIPWCLFSCQSLLHLKLSFCRVKPPTKFEGFKKLKSLELKHVTVTQNAFDKLINGSPLLERLLLEHFDGFTEIHIDAPNLKFIEFTGKFEDISFDNTPQLAAAYFNLSFYQNRLNGRSNNLLNLFDHLPRLKSTLICTHFLKYLASGVVPLELPTPCMNLRTLYLEIDFNDLKQISVVLCLLKSSPNIRKLALSVPLKKKNALLTNASYCWENLFSLPAMPLIVRRLMIKGISGTKPELYFIRFLFLYSPFLEKIIVKPDVNVNSILMTKLISLRKASVHAEVVNYGGSDSQFFSS
ncbi:F-box/FBD/LRR-repeat protein At1g13570 [Lathyrus oleraceus]|uniref:F-box/FBD/LRR-repeat protein At1g13570 n=1 Tax=Pisum sativum TaxID=3888 RepID=UPI0021CED576|nr:F-box/FBD/LRR-repeat protein At1g13570-like [Pisum sativum]